MLFFDSTPLTSDIMFLPSEKLLTAVLMNFKNCVSYPCLRLPPPKRFHQAQSVLYHEFRNGEIIAYGKDFSLTVVLFNALRV